MTTMCAHSVREGQAGLVQEGAGGDMEARARLDLVSEAGDTAHSRWRATPHRTRVVQCWICAPIGHRLASGADTSKLTADVR